jgi:hypothetical protein
LIVFPKNLPCLCRDSFAAFARSAFPLALPSLAAKRQTENRHRRPLAAMAASRDGHTQSKTRLQLAATGRIRGGVFAAQAATGGLHRNPVVLSQSGLARASGPRRDAPGGRSAAQTQLRRDAARRCGLGICPDCAMHLSDAGRQSARTADTASACRLAGRSSRECNPEAVRKRHAPSDPAGDLRPPPIQRETTDPLRAIGCQNPSKGRT